MSVFTGVRARRWIWRRLSEMPDRGFRLGSLIWRPTTEPAKFLELRKVSGCFREMTYLVQGTILVMSRLVSKHLSRFPLLVS